MCCKRNRVCNLNKSRERVKKELAKTVKITNFQLTQEEIEEKIDAGDVTVFSSIIK